VESPDVALFIKKVYSKLLDGYFRNASFFKPTGDGLLLTIPYNESNLQANVRQTIDSCLEITKTFCTFCENDPMVTFETPKKIGIGLSRGTACCLTSQDKIMDYSGRVLNLASRLMDVARPSGIVFDAAFGQGLLSGKQSALFSNDQIYVRGIAEIEPINIMYTKGLTTISSLYKRRLDDVEWEIMTRKFTFKELKDEKTAAPLYIVDLKTKPIDSTSIEVIVTYPSPVESLRKSGHRVVHSLDPSEFEYRVQAGKPSVWLKLEPILAYLAPKKLKSNSEVTIDIDYPKNE
jgi:hypothetical protein